MQLENDRSFRVILKLLSHVLLDSKLPYVSINDSLLTYAIHHFSKKIQYQPYMPITCTVPPSSPLRLTSLNPTTKAVIITSKSPPPSPQILTPQHFLPQMTCYFSSRLHNFHKLILLISNTNQYPTWVLPQDEKILNCTLFIYVYIIILFY